MGEQTAVGFTVTVLNNASTDNTIEVVEQFKKNYPNINTNIITNKVNVGNFGNFKKAQELACKKYVCVVHDDDVLHPMYFEKAMTLFSKYDDMVVVSGQNNFYVNPGFNNFPCPNNCPMIWDKKVGSLFALYVQRLSFQCAIYKTAVYKSVVMQMEEEGKVWDNTFLLDVMQYGRSAMMQFEVIRVRFHSGQDSETNVNGPFPHELKNQILHIKRLLKPYGLIGTLSTISFAWFIFSWSKIKTISLEEFMQSIIKPKISDRLAV